MPLPLAAIGLGVGALKLGQALFGNKGKKKAAEEADKAANEANQRKYDAESGSFQDDERVRGARLTAANSLLQHIAGGQYAISPEMLAQIAAPRRFSGSLGQRSTTSAGSGSALISGLLGSGADIGTDLLLGGLQAGTRPTVGASSPSMLPTNINAAPSLNRQVRF